MNELMNERNIPNHVVIIPDGNRRYAKKKGMPPWEGHRIGMKTFEKLLKWCKELGIKKLTFWTCSADNLKREKTEVKFLLKLFDDYANSFLKKFDKDKIKKEGNQARIRFIGNRSLLPKSLVEKIKKIEELTKDYSDYKLNFLMAYDGHWEITEAVKKIAQKVNEGKISVDDITSDMVENNLALTSRPDLIIRTGDKIRMSGLLSWQNAYSELFFVKDKFWPEFTKQDLEDAIDHFSNIRRNFGK